MILYIIITFFATVSVDILWSYYIKRVSQGKAFQAGLYAGLVYGNTVLITILYTENHWLCIPVIIGSVLGTYLAVKIDTMNTIDFWEYIDYIMS